MSLESVFRLSLIMNPIDNLTGPMAGVRSSVDGTVSKLQRSIQPSAAWQRRGPSCRRGGLADHRGGAVPGRGHLRDKTGDRRAGLPGRERPRGGWKTPPGSSPTNGPEPRRPTSSRRPTTSKAASRRLSDEGVAEFKPRGLTAKATKFTAGEMTSLFATGYGIYKGYYDDMSDLEFGEMFSAGIAKSVQQFKTTGSRDGLEH